MSELSLNQSNNTMGLIPLRLTIKDVCDLLRISRDRLGKYVKDDPTFPRPIKEGNSRQSPVYFDTKSIQLWWYDKLEKQNSDSKDLKHKVC